MLVVMTFYFQDQEINIKYNGQLKLANSDKALLYYIITPTPVFPCPHYTYYKTPFLGSCFLFNV